MLPQILDPDLHPGCYAAHRTHERLSGTIFIRVTKESSVRHRVRDFDYNMKACDRDLTGVTGESERVALRLHNKAGAMYVLWLEVSECARG